MGHEGMDYDPYTGVWTPKATKRKKEKRAKTPRSEQSKKQPQSNYSIIPRIKKWGLRLALAAALTSPISDQYTGIPGYVAGKILSVVDYNNESGQYWQAIHQRDDFKAKLEGKTLPQPQETKTERILKYLLPEFPDTDLIKEFPATETNEISIESDDPNYPIYRKAPTRQKLSCDRLNEETNIIKMIVAREDDAAYDHGGINYWGKLRAAAAWVKSGFSKKIGGSGLVEQVAKNATLDENQTSKDRHGLKGLEEKIGEMVYSLELGTLPRNDVICFYANTSYFAGGNHGVEAAAQDYFGKSALELTKAQAAFLAVLVKAPGLNPKLRKIEIVEKNGNKKILDPFQLQYDRYKKFVEQLHKDNKISETEYKEMIDPNSITISPRSRTTTSTFTGALGVVKDELQKRYGIDLYDMMQEDNLPYSLIVKTTIKHEDQLRLEAAVKREFKHPFVEINGILQPLADIGGVVLDKDRRIVSLLAGREYSGDIGKFNYVTSRDTASVELGSVIKPILYAFAYQYQGISPNSVWSEAGAGVRNWNGESHPPMQLKSALTASNNPITVNLWKHLFKRKNDITGNEQRWGQFLGYLEGLGFDTTEYAKAGREDNSLALGSRGGLTALGVAQVYSAFNDGILRDTTVIDSITLNGKEYHVQLPEGGKEVFDRKTREAILDSLEARADELKVNGWCKTGTGGDKAFRLVCDEENSAQDKDEFYKDTIDRVVSLFTTSKYGTMGQRKYAATELGPVLRAHQKQMREGKIYDIKEIEIRKIECLDDDIIVPQGRIFQADGDGINKLAEIYDLCAAIQIPKSEERIGYYSATASAYEALANELKCKGETAKAGVFLSNAILFYKRMARESEGNQQEAALGMINDIEAHKNDPPIDCTE